jgi:hypothetical protein
MFEVQHGDSSLPERPIRLRKYPLDTMEVGDWFFVPGKERNTIYSHVSTMGKRLGRKFSTRLCWMYFDRKWIECTPNSDNAEKGVLVQRVA